MLTLITGGSGSGKSAFAENLLTAQDFSSLVYLATMIPFDEECKRRIKRHQKMRAQKHFETVECFMNLKSINLSHRPGVLLECMSNLVANEMYHKDGAGEKTVKAILSGIHSLKEQSKHLVIVSNEVFSDGICYEEETKRYLNYLGCINQEIGKWADEVIEVVYSIPVYHKRLKNREDGGLGA